MPWNRWRVAQGTGSDRDQSKGRRLAFERRILCHFESEGKDERIGGGHDVLNRDNQPSRATSIFGPFKLETRSSTEIGLAT